MKIKLPEQIETLRVILKKHFVDVSYIRLWVDSINCNLKWLNQFLPRFSKNITFEEEKSFIESEVTEEKEIGYGIWNKKTNELMGSIGVFNFEEQGKFSNIELGFILFEKFAGDGYGPEVIEALTQTLFSIGLDGVMAKIDEKNIRSRRAVEKAGLTWDGQEKQRGRSNPNKLLLIYRKKKDSPN